MGKVALMFPGQGSQYVGMGKSLCEEFPTARRAFEEASEALRIDMKRLCFEGSPHQLSETSNTQPAILCFSIAALRVLWEEVDLKPSYAIGHSLGEYTALTCCGGIRFADALRIVRKRGELMQGAVTMGKGSMVTIIGLGKEIIIEICQQLSSGEKVVVPANYNSPRQVVISGHREKIEEAVVSLKKKGATAIIPLKVSALFHSPLMQPVTEKTREELVRYSYNDLAFPVVSNVAACPYRTSREIAENLTRQIYSPVLWQDSMMYIWRQGVSRSIEIGPKRVLTGLMKGNASSVQSVSFEKGKDFQPIIELLSDLL